MILLHGDHLAHGGRSPLGLAGTLHEATGQVVLDRAVAGGLRDVIRRAGDNVGAELPMWHPAVLVVGTTDARAGGCVPAVFMQQLRHAALTLRVPHDDPGSAHTGRRVLVVVPPAAPPEVRCPRGYGRGSRRWRERIDPLVRDWRQRLGLSSRIDVVPWDVVGRWGLGDPALWADAMTLRPSGLRALAAGIAAHLG